MNDNLLNASRALETNENTPQHEYRIDINEVHDDSRGTNTLTPIENSTVSTNHQKKHPIHHSPS